MTKRHKYKHAPSTSISVANHSKADVDEQNPRSRFRAQRKYAASFPTASPSSLPRRNCRQGDRDPESYGPRALDTSQTRTKSPHTQTDTSTGLPSTEDFISYLCFRGTPLVRPELAEIFSHTSLCREDQFVSADHTQSPVSAVTCEEQSAKHGLVLKSESIAENDGAVSERSILSSTCIPNDSFNLVPSPHVILHKLSDTVNPTTSHCLPKSPAKSVSTLVKSESDEQPTVVKAAANMMRPAARNSLRKTILKRLRVSNTLRYPLKGAKRRHFPSLSRKRRHCSNLNSAWSNRNESILFKNRISGNSNKRHSNLLNHRNKLPINRVKHTMNHNTVTNVQTVRPNKVTANSPTLIKRRNNKKRCNSRYWYWLEESDQSYESGSDSNTTVTVVPESKSVIECNTRRLRDGTLITTKVNRGARDTKTRAQEAETVSGEFISCEDRLHRSPNVVCTDNTQHVAMDIDDVDDECLSQSISESFVEASTECEVNEDGAELRSSITSFLSKLSKKYVDIGTDTDLDTVTMSKEPTFQVVTRNAETQTSAAEIRPLNGTRSIGVSTNVIHSHDSSCIQLLHGTASRCMFDMCTNAHNLALSTISPNRVFCSHTNCWWMPSDAPSLSVKQNYISKTYEPERSSRCLEIKHEDIRVQDEDECESRLIIDESSSVNGHDQQHQDTEALHSSTEGIYTHEHLIDRSNFDRSNGAKFDQNSSINSKLESENNSLYSLKTEIHSGAISAGQDKSRACNRFLQGSTLNPRIIHDNTLNSKISYDSTLGCRVSEDPTSNSRNINGSTVHSKIINNPTFDSQVSNDSTSNLRVSDVVTVNSRISTDSALNLRIFNDPASKRCVSNDLILKSRVSNDIFNSKNSNDTTLNSTVSNNTTLEFRVSNDPTSMRRVSNDFTPNPIVFNTILNSTASNDSTSKRKVVENITLIGNDLNTRSSDISGSVSSDKTSYETSNASRLPSSNSRLGAMFDVPVFHPSVEEFADPFKYIDSLHARLNGLEFCRIVPPTGFNPECRVDDDMRFITYNHYVHKVYKRWGPNFCDLMTIRRYLDEQSIEMENIPTVAGIELDLPRLYHIVQTMGGLNTVVYGDKWSTVAVQLGLPKPSVHCSRLDDIYCSFLLGYAALSSAEQRRLREATEVEWMRRQQRHLLRRSVCDQQPGDHAEEEDEEEEDDDDAAECIVKGKSTNLASFYRTSKNMFQYYYQNQSVSTIQIERDFWKLVTDRTRHVCVYSGSVDCGPGGYGFVCDKRFVTAKHAWNLKNFSNHKQSLLRVMGNIMGLNVPTLHMGMLYTAGCWYYDPHVLPWIEYLHTGCDKIWYFVLSSQRAQFESVVRAQMPADTLRETPVWLSSDTCMIPPECLLEHGVQVYRTVQKAGEFVVSFSGFCSYICTGYVLAESVFFATDIYLDIVQKVFSDLSESCEPSLFSYEQLVVALCRNERYSSPTLRKSASLLERIASLESTQLETLRRLGVSKCEEMDKPSHSSHRTSKHSVAQPVEADSRECDVCRKCLYSAMVETPGENNSDQIYLCLSHAITALEESTLKASDCKIMHMFSHGEYMSLVAAALEKC